MKTTIIILHDIRSAQNVGSMFRTADACGVSKIYLTGYTPAPLDRFNREVKEITKTALGAERVVSWEKTSLANCLKKLKSEDFYIIAVEQDKCAVDYKTVKLKNKSALLFGNEVDGLSASDLKECDIVAEIPMHGKKESLNVSVALGVVLYRMLNL